MKRTKPPKEVTRTLAIATPSDVYRWYRSLRRVTVEARLREGKIYYYEKFNGSERRISEQLVIEMFPTTGMVRERPFLVKENQDFYAVLNRHKNRYKDQYKKLKNKR
ncbi:unnamed protein product [marine sediment metagenome]|uniref:Uncharacterized protein n=1 Tax=marine sediment metagenome TaxID=412755 RepID=X0TIT1_9ZZZZ